MSSGCGLASLLTVLFVDLEVVEDDSGQAASEAAQGFGEAFDPADHRCLDTHAAIATLIGSWP